MNCGPNVKAETINLLEEHIEGNFPQLVLTKHDTKSMSIKEKKLINWNLSIWSEKDFL